MNQQPPDDSAQVVAHDRYRVHVKRPNEGGQLLAHDFGRVTAPRHWLVRVRESFQVQDDHAKESGQLFDLVPPAEPKVRESVQQQNDRVCRIARLHVVEFDALQLSNGWTAIDY